MTPQRVYNVLFLCTGNSARSILAEAILNSAAAAASSAFSAGSHPNGRGQSARARAAASAWAIRPTGLRSKSWDEFAAPGAPAMDFVFTVCDNAAGEVCPVWPGQPMTAHWGIADPAAVEGTDVEKARAFARGLPRAATTASALFSACRSPRSTGWRCRRRLDEIGRDGRRDRA